LKAEVDLDRHLPGLWHKSGRMAETLDLSLYQAWLQAATRKNRQGNSLGRVLNEKFLDGPRSWK
jgi:hypothetical protein